MFKFTTASLVALAATAASVHAQEIPAGPANASAIALVEAQYNASGFDGMSKPCALSCFDFELR